MNPGNSFASGRASDDLSSRAMRTMNETVAAASIGDQRRPSEDDVLILVWDNAAFDAVRGKGKLCFSLAI